jgi:hypothetical protein
MEVLARIYFSITGYKLGKIFKERGKRDGRQGQK